MGVKNSILVGAILVIVSTLTSVYAREIKDIKIEKYGLSEILQDPPSEGCKDFKPTVGQVRYFFSKAYPVDSYLSVQTFYSLCYAEGTIEYADGNRGTWVLRSSGIAGIEWERSGRVVLFYGHNKWYDPFVGTYDENGV